MRATTMLGRTLLTVMVAVHLGAAQVQQRQDQVEEEEVMVVNLPGQRKGTRYNILETQLPQSPWRGLQEVITQQFKHMVPILGSALDESVQGIKDDLRQELNDLKTHLSHKIDTRNTRNEEADNSVMQNNPRFAPPAVTSGANGVIIGKGGVRPNAPYEVIRHNLAMAELRRLGAELQQVITDEISKMRKEFVGTLNEFRAKIDNSTTELRNSLNQEVAEQGEESTNMIKKVFLYNRNQMTLVNNRLLNISDILASGESLPTAQPLYADDTTGNDYDIFKTDSGRSWYDWYRPRYNTDRPDYYTDSPYRRYNTDIPNRRYNTDSPYRRYNTDRPDYYTDSPYRRYNTDSPNRRYNTDSPYRRYNTDRPDYYTDRPYRRYNTDSPYRRYNTDRPRFSDRRYGTTRDYRRWSPAYPRFSDRRYGTTPDYRRYSPDYYNPDQPYWKSGTVDWDYEASTETYHDDSNLPSDCQDLSKFNGVSGQTRIQISNDTDPQWVWCDQNTDGGGWTVLMRRQRQGNQLDFRQDWEHYKTGFGDANGEYWIGLETMSRLTQQGEYELKVIMGAGEENATAHYTSFRVGGRGSHHSEYRLHVSGYNASSSAGDAMEYHNGQEFSTYDKDNDQASGGSCSEWSGGGGWWYNYCYYSNPTGVYPPDDLPPGTEVDHLVEWRKWQGYYTYLTSFTMMTRQRV